MDNTIENYKILVTKETPDEKVIFRDIHRTFPAHEFFKVNNRGGTICLTSFRTLRCPGYS